MTAYDPDFTGSDLDYDLQDFDARDALDADRLAAFYTEQGFAARPGTRRPLSTEWTETGFGLDPDADERATAALLELAAVPL